MTRFKVLGAVAAVVLIAGSSMASPAERCRPPGPQDPVIYSQDFRWGYSLDELRAVSSEFYRSPKRLPDRARWNAERGAYVMPFRAEQGGDVVIPTRLIESVRKHIEAALERRYIDGVVFPDMGHSHFYLPQEVWDRDYAAIPIAETARLYERMMDDPSLRVLYHTAEQLQTLDAERNPLANRDVQWRFHTRNIFGDNRGLGILEIRNAPESRANTVSELPGYKVWSAGFNLSANESGCFPFKVAGENRWFDLSLSDLGPDPSKPFLYDAAYREWRHSH